MNKNFNNFNSKDKGGKSGSANWRKKDGPGLDRKSDFDQKVLDIARVTRVTKGGKRFSFRATVVIGDKKGSVGLGVAQGKDVSQSIQKAVHQAKKGLIKVQVKNGTILHQVTAKFSSAVVILKPAGPGNGVKAGGPVRAVAKLSGIENITAKLLSRTGNKINIAKAALEALKKLRLEIIASEIKTEVKTEVNNPQINATT
ncbi:MAG: 30S ribosomal protein S5 [Candidatus Yanofskybacteria bacterium]|nr:30S ribosomal protein S5 [Candidatus Yanofskybacteria bacterium]